MKYIFCKWIFVCCILTAFTSCNKLVEIDPPIGRISNENVFKSPAAAAAVMTGIYSQLGNSSFIDGFRGITFYAGMAADEFTLHFLGRDAFSQFYANALLSTNPDLPWKQIYNYIYSCNAMLEGLEGSPLSETLKTQLAGEAKFTRAFMNFYLTNLYDSIPLVTTTDYTVNNRIMRSSQADAYKLIIEDLVDAKEKLSMDYKGSNAVTPTTARARPNKFAANALLGRAYLHTGNWKGAEEEATLVIDQKAIYDTVPLKDVFLVDSKETIWQAQQPAASRNTMDGYRFIMVSAPNDNEAVSLSPFLLNAFETGDKRRQDWVGSVTVNNVTYYFPYKYKVKQSTTTSEYLMLLRLAELYLIRAEARARRGNISGAQDDLNLIRTRAGLPNTTANDETSLLEACLRERQVEFFAERGQRWIDIKRTGKVDEVMTAAASHKNTTWKPEMAWWPLHQEDLLRNNNLHQNKGYAF